jgi:hypothetical protein
MEEQHKAHLHRNKLERKTANVQSVLEASKRQKVAEHSAWHSEQDFLVEDNQLNDYDGPTDTSHDSVPTQNYLDDYNDYQLPDILWNQYKEIVKEMLSQYMQRHSKYPPAHLLIYYVSMDRRFVKHLQEEYGIYFSDDDVETARYKGTENLKGGETFHLLSEQNLYNSLPNDVAEILQLKRHRYRGRILGNAYEALLRHIKSPLPNILLTIGRDQLNFVKRSLEDHDNKTEFYIGRANDWAYGDGQGRYELFDADQKTQWKQFVSNTRLEHIKSHQNDLRELESKFATDFNGQASNAKFIDEIDTDTREIKTLRGRANALFESGELDRNIKSNMQWTALMGKIITARENVVHKRNMAEHKTREKRHEKKQVNMELKSAIKNVLQLEVDLRAANDKLRGFAANGAIDIEPMCPLSEEDERVRLKNSQKIAGLQNAVTEAGRLLEAEEKNVADLKTRSHILTKDVDQAKAVLKAKQAARSRCTSQQDAESKECAREAEIKSEMASNGLTRALATERVDCKETFEKMELTIANIKAGKESLERAKAVKSEWEHEKKQQIQGEFDRKVHNASELLEKIKDATTKDFVAVQSVYELKELAEHAKEKWKSVAKDEKVLHEGIEYGWEELYKLNDEIILTKSTSSQFVIEQKKHFSAHLLDMLNTKRNTSKMLLKSQWQHWNATLNAARTKRQALDSEKRKFDEQLMRRLLPIGDMQKIKAIATRLYAVMDKDNIDTKPSNEVARMVSEADPNGELGLTLISMFSDTDSIWQDVLKECLVNGQRIKRGLSQLNSSVVSTDGESFQGLLDKQMDLEKEIADADYTRCAELRKYYDIVDADRLSKRGGKIARDYEAKGPMNSDLGRPMFVKKGKSETKTSYKKAGLDVTNPFILVLDAKQKLEDDKKRAKKLYEKLVNNCRNHAISQYEDELVALNCGINVEDLNALRVAAQAALVPERLEEFEELRAQIAIDKHEEKEKQKMPLAHVFGFSAEDNLDKKLNLDILEINKAAKQGSGRAKHYYRLLCNIFKSVIGLEDQESVQMRAFGQASVRTIPLEYQGQFEQLNCDAQNDLSGEEPEIPKPVFEQMRKATPAIREYYDKLANVAHRWASIRPELRAGAWPTMEERVHLTEVARNDASGNKPRIDEDTGEVVFMSQWNMSKKCSLDGKDAYPNTVIWVSIDGTVLPVDHDGNVVRMLRDVSGTNVTLTAVLHQSLKELKEYHRGGKTTSDAYARASSWAQMQQRYAKATRDLQVMDIENNVALKQAHVTHALASKNNADLLNELRKLISEKQEKIDRMHRYRNKQTRDYSERVPIIDDVASFLPDIQEDAMTDLSTLRTGADELERIREVAERIQSIENEVTLIQRENERFPTSQPWLLSFSLTRSSNKVVSITQAGDAPIHTSTLVKYLQDWNWVWNKELCEFAQVSINKWLDTCYTGMPNMRVPILGRSIEDDLTSRTLPWLASLYHNGFEFPQIDLNTKTIFLEHIVPQAKLRFGLYPDTLTGGPKWRIQNNQWSYNTVTAGNWVQNYTHTEEEMAASDNGRDDLATRIRNNNIDSVIAQTSSSNHGDLVTIFNEAENMRVFSPKPDSDEEFLRSSSAAVASLAAASFPTIVSPGPDNLWLDLVDKETVYHGTLASVPKPLQGVVMGALNDALKHKSAGSMEITFVISNKLHRIHIFDINFLEHPPKNEDVHESYDRWLGANQSYPALVSGAAEHPPPASSNIGETCGYADSYTGFSKGDTVLYVSKSRGEVMATVLEAGVFMPETCGLPNSYTVQLHDDEKSVVNTTHKHLVRVLDALPETLVTSTKYLSLTYDPGPISSPYDAFGKPKRAKKK